MADYIGIMRKEKQDPKGKNKMFNYNGFVFGGICEDLNLELGSMVDNKLIEPIDDPNEFIVQEDFSWVVGMNSGNEYYYADNGEF